MNINIDDPAAEDLIVARAENILTKRLLETSISGDRLSAPPLVKQYLRHKLMLKQAEEFGIIYLDIKHRVISTETLFTGTVNHCSIYPREVLRAVLKNNAASVIFYHNHPSGDSNPSQADVTFTAKLVALLKELEVLVVDHIILAGHEHYSFAEYGRI